ncbi:OmpH family outer membrane protein [Pararhodobacter sp. SW119]|uniref:OmpH family outer membrane protein n=1 Tax=Pararhodobacter sp. SW119 TaxID=2780075 RepID=UPI001ADEE23A|nr:OmpH family outer membrane protein [Pararhodobacter sp. SW119]
MPGRLRGALLAAAVVCLGGAASAQDADFRILNEERLLRESRYGQAVLAGVRDAERRLEAENERIAGELAAAERALTEARAELSPEEFRLRADEFDRRVEAIRAERNELSLELARQSDAAASRFFDEALPVLLELMSEDGLVAILRPDALILGADWLDMTDRVIERLDSAFGDREPPPLAD